MKRLIRWLLRKFEAVAMEDARDRGLIPPPGPRVTYGTVACHPQIGMPGPFAAPQSEGSGGVGLLKRPTLPGPPPLGVAGPGARELLLETELAQGEGASSPVPDCGPLEIAGQSYQFFVCAFSPMGMMMGPPMPGATTMPMVGPILAGPFTSYGEAQEATKTLQAQETIVLPLPVHVFKRRPIPGIFG